MSGGGPIERDLIFISKVTPGDDQFVLWLTPRLEAAGCKVFADIFDFDAGDEWRGRSRPSSVTTIKPATTRASTM